jgi:hypothetical protein
MADGNHGVRGMAQEPYVSAEVVADYLKLDRRQVLALSRRAITTSPQILENRTNVGGRKRQNAPLTRHSRLLPRRLNCGIHAGRSEESSGLSPDTHSLNRRLFENELHLKAFRERRRSEQSNCRKNNWCDQLPSSRTNH